MKSVSLSFLILATHAASIPNILADQHSSLLVGRDLEVHERRWTNEDNAWSASVHNFLTSYLAKASASGKSAGPVRTFTQYDTVTTTTSICNTRNSCSQSTYITSANPRTFTETAYVFRTTVPCSGGNCVVAAASQSVLPATINRVSTSRIAGTTTSCNTKNSCTPVATTRTSVITQRAIYTASVPPIAQVTGSTIKSSSTTTRLSSSTSKITIHGGGSSTVDAEIQTPSSTTTRTTTTTRPTTTSLRTTTTTTTTKKTTTTTTTAGPGATQTINVTGMTYQNAMMVAHNVHRSNHSLPNLNWNQDLANTAQHIAQNCVYGHNVTADGGGYGQNIGAGAAGNAAAGLVTNLMYNGEINYYPLPYGDDDPSLDNFHLWGHYSQLVWDDTTDVGCYTQYCPQGLANTQVGVAPYFTVCNYSPPGNYVGEFSSVAPPNGGASVVITGS